MKIDSHQHFWNFDPVRDSWINDEMAAIRRDFLPSDLFPILQEQGFDGCITVQSDQSEAENGFQLKQAGEHGFIKGVVGWVDLQSHNCDERLSHYQTFEKMKGFRHILQGEEDRALMLKPAFMKGVGLLRKYNFTYDILIFPDQLDYCCDLVRAFPDQQFILDHIAKPSIRTRELSPWDSGITALAAYENVSCKISGMVTEADWKNWAPGHFTPYLDTVFNAFGSKRVLFGSDWPVCQIAGGYNKVVQLVKDYTAELSKEEQDDFWGDNAVRVYKL